MLPLEELIADLKTDPKNFIRYAFTDIFPRLFPEMVLTNTKVTTILADGTIITQLQFTLSKPSTYVMKWTDLTSRCVPVKRTLWQCMFSNVPSTILVQDTPRQERIAQYKTFDLFFIRDIHDLLSKYMKTRLNNNILVVCSNDKSLIIHGKSLNNYLLKIFNYSFGDSSRFTWNVSSGSIYTPIETYFDNKFMTSNTCINLLPGHKDIIPHDGYTNIQFTVNLDMTVFTASAIIDELTELLNKPTAVAHMLAHNEIVDAIVDGVVVPPCDIQNVTYVTPIIDKSV